MWTEMYELKLLIFLIFVILVNFSYVYIRECRFILHVPKIMWYTIHQWVLVISMNDFNWSNHFTTSNLTHSYYQEFVESREDRLWKCTAGSRYCLALSLNEFPRCENLKNLTKYFRKKLRKWGNIDLKKNIGTISSQIHGFVTIH